jgi:hypothetical protein
MSNLTDAEDAHRQQRAGVQRVGGREARRTYRRSHEHVSTCRGLTKVWPKALQDEHTAPHVERPRV